MSHLGLAVPHRTSAGSGQGWEKEGKWPQTQSDTQHQCLAERSTHQFEPERYMYVHVHVDTMVLLKAHLHGICTVQIHTMY